MGQQISVEDAFPVYRKRCGELFDETLVLRAQVDVLEKQLAAAQEENAQLRAEIEPPQAMDALLPDAMRPPE
jgi:hypothetical protein